MPDKFMLARQFVEAYPQAAARALEELATAQASTFIDAVPDEDSSSILGSMLPYHAAKCIAELSDDAAARYLGGLEPRSIANILQHTQDETRRAILAKLPRRLAPRVAIILNYSLLMVGAWLEPTVLSLPSDCTVGEAKSRLKNEGYVDFHRVYVVDRTRGLKGFVRLSALIKANEETPLTDYLEPLTRVLRASTSLDMAIEDTAWMDSDYLPVIDRRERFLGVVRYADLRAALSRPRPIIADQDISSGFMDLAEFCYLGLADVMNTSLAIERAANDAGEQ